MYFMYLFFFIRIFFLYIYLFSIYPQAVFVFQMTDIGPTQFSGYVFPDWADAIGWLIGASTLMPFFGFLLYRLIKGPVSRKNCARNGTTRIIGHLHGIYLFWKCNN